MNEEQVGAGISGKVPPVPAGEPGVPVPVGLIPATTETQPALTAAYEKVNEQLTGKRRTGVRQFLAQHPEYAGETEALTEYAGMTDEEKLRDTELIYPMLHKKSGMVCQTVSDDGSPPEENDDYEIKGEPQPREVNVFPELERLVSDIEDYGYERKIAPFIRIVKAYQKDREKLGKEKAHKGDLAMGWHRLFPVDMKCHPPKDEKMAVMIRSIGVDNLADYAQRYGFFSFEHFILRGIEILVKEGEARPGEAEEIDRLIRGDIPLIRSFFRRYQASGDKEQFLADLCKKPGSMREDAVLITALTLLPPPLIW